MADGKAYTAPDITVTYDIKKCIHVEACVRGLPQVFNTQARPWIQPNNASADEVAEVIQRCPTGALQYHRTDGEPDEAPQEEATVQIRPNGPLFVRGAVKITDTQGNVLFDSARMALCRCGGSENKPFCDGTHRKNGFKG